LSVLQRTCFRRRSGVAADARDWDRLTALIGAAAAGQCAVLAMLLNAGADPRAADKDGATACVEIDL